MASRVIRLKEVANIEHSVYGATVVLKATGRCEGRETRVELELDGYEISRVVNALRVGVAAHVRHWSEAQKALNQP